VALMEELVAMLAMGGRRRSWQREKFAVAPPNVR